MKPHFLLVHGWGFDETFWTPLRQALGGEDTVAWDLGFFGKPAQPPLPVGRKVVAVGHSFGLLWLLHHRPLVWHALASINGFACFTRRETFPEGAAVRPLERMILQCAADPSRVVSDFRVRCGHSVPPPKISDQGNLLLGLQGLISWDERPANLHSALCGRGDPLVSAAISAANFSQDRIQWHDGGHLLPLEDPAWCSEQLSQIAGNLP
jgi:pimeloyl-[acyl-carrier protein] methyl ester esterase